MKTLIRGLFLLVVVATLSACSAGKSFNRADVSQLVLGGSTQEDVIAIMGKPVQRGEILRNNVTAKSLIYGFASTTAKPLYEGVTPAKSQRFYFYENKLVGYEYTSSFADDGTDFDGSKASQIVENESSVGDAIELFGAPQGRFVYPLTSERSNYAIAYLYIQTKGAFKPKVKNKVLVIEHDENQVVTKVEYILAGNSD